MDLEATYIEFTKNRERINKEVVSRLWSEYNLTEFENHFVRHNMQEKDLLKLLQHSTYVVEIAKRIIDLAEVSEDDIRLVLSAALLHDISKFEEKRNDGVITHDTLGQQYVLNNNVYEDDNTNALLGTIIKFHKEADLELNKRELLLCNIVHDADKISKIFKKKSWLNKDKEFDMETINEVVSKVRRKLQLPQSQEVLRDYLKETGMGI